MNRNQNFGTPPGPKGNGRSTRDNKTALTPPCPHCLGCHQGHACADGTSVRSPRGDTPTTAVCSFDRGCPHVAVTTTPAPTTGGTSSPCRGNDCSPPSDRRTLWSSIAQSSIISTDRGADAGNDGTTTVAVASVAGSIARSAISRPRPPPLQGRTLFLLLTRVYEWSVAPRVPLTLTVSLILPHSHSRPVSPMTACGARTPTGGFPPLQGPLSFVPALAAATTAPPDVIHTTRGRSLPGRSLPRAKPHRPSTLSPPLLDQIPLAPPALPHAALSPPRTRATAPLRPRPTSPRPCGSFRHPPCANVS
mmetsp:Transcript_20462/g.45622  ORF Transcript_20462/g.45622 Transcript_20462/m.45622 type:complete len:306 (+) Transcript_20462:488-1405(+)